MLVILGAVACRMNPPEPQAHGAWIEETGIAYSSTNNPTGRLKAEVVYAAENEARAKIREQFDQIEAKPGVTIYQAMEASPYVWSRIMGILASTKAYQTEIQKDGSVKVRLRVNIDQLKEIAAYGEEAETAS